MTSTSDRIRRAGADPGSHPIRAGAFTLIELLTVVFIISLLIGILIPSINSARNAAKKATTAKLLQSIDVGMELFKNDNESDFRLSNGYPPSFAHPPISGYTLDPYLGQFPFLDPISESNPPRVYGAHWLPAMLMGPDNLGYLKRSSVPRKNDLRKKPWLWYSHNPLGDGMPLSERQPLYLDPGNVETKATAKLAGRPPDSSGGFFPDWDTMNGLPVIVDAFDQPVLYYVASARGRTTNMVVDEHLQNNDYSGSADQDKGFPFYFHQDNEGFTGTEAEAGWDFGGRPKGHTIAESGALLNAVLAVDPANRQTFTRYIMDRKIYTLLLGNANAQPTAALRPVNSESYLLITAGPDGRFGTADDVSNLPPFPDD